MEPRDNSSLLVTRRNYNIPAAYELTEEMILGHWNSGKGLTDSQSRADPRGPLAGI